MSIIKIIFLAALIFSTIIIIINNAIIFNLLLVGVNYVYSNNLTNIKQRINK